MIYIFHSCCIKLLFWSSDACMLVSTSWHTSFSILGHLFTCHLHSDLQATLKWLSLLHSPDFFPWEEHCLGVCSVPQYLHLSLHWSPFPQFYVLLDSIKIFGLLNAVRCTSLYALVSSIFVTSRWKFNSSHTYLAHPSCIPTFLAPALHIFASDFHSGLVLWLASVLYQCLWMSW